MVTCTLRIGDRIVLSSVGAAPEVEYALFDPGEIELAASGPGMVQEIGYQTAAADASARLRDAGVTWPLVLDAGSAMQPTLAMTYARGAAVRRIANSLGPAELFDGFRYDAGARQYDGRWLDLPALGLDLGFARFTQAVQLMHLLALLEEVTPEDPVRLVTRELMATARPGTRSFRRGMAPDVSGLPDKLRAFAARLREAKQVEMSERMVGPSPGDLIEILRDRVVLSPDADSQDRLRAIERALGIRQRAMRGPLADPELAALDEQLSAGKVEGVGPILDVLEKSRGKQPATTYLRVRASLVSGRDPPRAVAERISSLALSMPSFVELELLASEAWSCAGDPKRALPFARDLISNATVNDELRVRESQQLAAMRPSQIAMEQVKAPQRQRTYAMEAEPPPLAEPPAPQERRSLVPETLGSPPPPDGQEAVREAMRRRSTQALPQMQSEIKTARPRPRHSATPPPVSVPPLPVPASSRRETPPMMFGVTDPNDPPRLAPVPTTRSPNVPVKKPISGTWVGPPPGAATSGNTQQTQWGAVPPPPPLSERAGPSTRPPPARQVSSRPPVAASPQLSPVSRRPTSRPPIDPPRLANHRATELMRGASQPPFRSDSPEAHVHVPRAPSVPRIDDLDAEEARFLELPEGMSGLPEPVDTLPRTVLDARIQFTFLSRELGRQYEDDLGVILRADISGVEAMQGVLLERYKTRSVSTPEAAADARRHGAFLSEILARSFGGFWVDIGPNDVGYWAMVVPPSTRVWPFGRILRLIAMQHNERDLVSYFLELSSRANSLR